MLKRFINDGYATKIKNSHIGKVIGCPPFIYELTQLGVDALIYDEERHQPTHFSHFEAWEFNRLGKEEVPGKKIQMKNWWYVDRPLPNGYIIRITPNLLIVFINEEMHAKDLENLDAKYIVLAIQYATKFAQDNNLKIELIPKRYHDPHYLLKDNPHARVMTKRKKGTIQYERSGIKFHENISRSTGDVEAEDIKNAKEIDYRLFEAVKVIARLSLTVDKMSEKMTVLERRQDHDHGEMYNKLKAAIEELAMLMVLKNEQYKKTALKDDPSYV